MTTQAIVIGVFGYPIQPDYDRAIFLLEALPVGFAAARMIALLST